MMVKIEEISCCSCGVSFWITSNHTEDLRKSHKLFYCPNGHGQHFTGKNEADEAKKRAASLEANLNSVRNQLSESRQQSDIYERSIRGYKGKIGQLKRRIQMQET